MASLQCYNKGCGQTYEPEKNTPGTYQPKKQKPKKKSIF